MFVEMHVDESESDAGVKESMIVSLSPKRPFQF